MNLLQPGREPAEHREETSQAPHPRWRGENSRGVAQLEVHLEESSCAEPHVCESKVCTLKTSRLSKNIKEVVK